MSQEHLYFCVVISFHRLNGMIISRQGDTDFQIARAVPPWLLGALDGWTVFLYIVHFYYASEHTSGHGILWVS